MANYIQIKNKKAFHDFQIEERFVAGIQLYGTEIKAIRAGKAGLTDSYCIFMPTPRHPDKKELWVKMHIAEYTHGNMNNHEPRRERKLLLSKRELKKIDRKTQGKGVSIVPIRLFINEKGLAKIEIAIATGKKLYDKRETLKDSDNKRELDRVMKSKL